jgi:hypothetical protein
MVSIPMNDKISFIFDFDRLHAEQNRFVARGKNATTEERKGDGKDRSIDKKSLSSCI